MSQAFNASGSSAHTVMLGERHWANLPLTKDDAAKLHHALYLAYGNDCGDLWARFREAIGEDWWAEIVGRP